MAARSIVFWPTCCAPATCHLFKFKVTSLLSAWNKGNKKESWCSWSIHRFASWTQSPHTDICFTAATECSCPALTVISASVFAVVSASKTSDLCKILLWDVYTVCVFVYVPPFTEILGCECVCHWMMITLKQHCVTLPSNNSLWVVKWFSCTEKKPINRLTRAHTA